MGFELTILVLQRIEKVPCVKNNSLTMNEKWGENLSFSVDFP